MKGTAKPALPIAFVQQPAAQVPLTHHGMPLNGGLILCRIKNRIVAEYALRDLDKPIGVSAYVTRLVETLPKSLRAAVPSVKEIESGLASAARPARHARKKQ